MVTLGYSIEEFARKYYDLGWNVIPLFEYSKNPATGAKLMDGGWLKYQTQRITEEEFTRFFIDNKPTGVGLVTGKISGVVVVDEDSYKAGGMTFHLDSPLKVRTANGGTHYFFRYEDAVKTSGFRQGVNIEIKSDGGFIVLPPSTVLDKQGKKAMYEWLSAVKTDKLPSISENELTKYKAPQGDQVELSELLEASQGERHNNLRTIALKMFNKFDKTEWSIAADFVRTAASKFNPPNDLKDTERVIKDAMLYVTQHPKEGFAPPPVVEEEKPSNIRIYSSEEADNLYAEKQKEFGEGITTGYAKLDEYFKFLPEQIYMLSAATHIGKTTLALNMASLIARTGKEVLFASLEQGVYVVPRIKSILGTTRLPLSMSILDADGFPNAEGFIKAITALEKKPDILFIDHLHYFARGNRGATEEIDRIVTEIQIMSKKLKLPILVISHVRKLNDNKAPTMDDMKDSVSLSQVPAVVMLLSREKVDTDLLLDGQPIFAQEGKLLINKNRIQGKTGMLTVKVETNGVINILK